MEITIRYNQRERAEFIEWILAEYPDAEVDDTVDSDGISDDANITLNELWSAYCESQPLRRSLSSLAGSNGWTNINY